MNPAESSPLGSTRARASPMLAVVLRLVVAEPDQEVGEPWITGSAGRGAGAMEAFKPSPTQSQPSRAKTLRPATSYEAVDGAVRH